MARGPRPARLDVVAPAGGRYDNIRAQYRKNADQMALALARAEKTRRTICLGLPLEAVAEKIARARAMAEMTDAQLDVDFDESRIAILQRLAELSKGGR